jgi:hypothetical protein
MTLRPWGHAIFDTSRGMMRGSRQSPAAPRAPRASEALMVEDDTPFVDYELNHRLGDHIVLDPGGCLIWTGTMSVHGYGVMHRERGSRLIHRLAYQLVNGPIPEGLDLDHLCRNRACFNPDHLEPVTRGENIRRGHPFRKPKERCNHGHLMEGDNVLVVPSGHGDGHQRICRECRRKSARDWQRRNYQSRRKAKTT